MTSFISKTLAFISHEHETVTAVFAASRTLMSSSIVPVTLSDNSVWDLIHARPFTKIKEDTFFSLFSSFSDTMQFTEKLCFTEKVETGVANALIRDLIDNKPYFCSTLRHIDFPHVDCIVATFSASPSSPASDATASPTTADDNNNPPTTATTRFRNVRTIGLQHCQDLRDNHLQLIAQGFPQLEKLNLSGRSFSYEVLSEAMSKLTRLEELDLSSVNEVNNLSCLKTAKKLRKLKLDACRAGALESDIFGNNFLPPSSASDGSCWLPSLTELSLEYCFLLTSASFQQIAQQAPNLVSLIAGTLSGSLDRGNQTEVYTEGISALHSLRRLKLLDCRGFNEDCVKALTENLHHIEEFDVSGDELDRGVNDNCLSHIAESWPALRILRLRNITNFTNEGFSYLTALPNIEQIDTDNHNPQFTGDIGNTRQFSQSLKCLCFQNCWDVDGRGLGSIMKRLSLRTLVLDRNDSVSSECLQQIFTRSHDGVESGSSSSSSSSSTSNSQASLENLTLISCSKLRNLSFLEGLVSLKTFRLTNEESNRWGVSSRDGLDYSAMRKNKNGLNLLSSSFHLRELNMSQSNVQDTDIIDELPQSVVSSLKVLKIENCSKLTQKVIFEGVSRMSFLEKLDMNGTCHRDKNDPRPSWKDIDDLLSNKLRNLKKFEVGDMLSHHIDCDPVLYRKFGHLIIKDNDQWLRLGGGRTTLQTIANNIASLGTATTTTATTTATNLPSNSSSNNNQKSAVNWGKGWTTNSANTTTESSVASAATKNINDSNTDDGKKAQDKNPWVISDSSSTSNTNSATAVLLEGLEQQKHRRTRKAKAGRPNHDETAAANPWSNNNTSNNDDDGSSSGNNNNTSSWNSNHQQQTPARISGGWGSNNGWGNNNNNNNNNSHSNASWSTNIHHHQLRNTRWGAPSTTTTTNNDDEEEEEEEESRESAAQLFNRAFGGNATSTAPTTNTTLPTSNNIATTIFGRLVNDAQYNENNSNQQKESASSGWGNSSNTNQDDASKETSSDAQTNKNPWGSNPGASFENSAAGIAIHEYEKDKNKKKNKKRKHL